MTSSKWFFYAARCLGMFLASVIRYPAQWMFVFFFVSTFGFFRYIFTHVTEIKSPTALAALLGGMISFVAAIIIGLGHKSDD